MRRHRFIGTCHECRRPVASGGDRHKKGHCPPGKRTQAEARALEAGVQGLPIVIPATYLEPWQRRAATNRY